MNEWGGTLVGRAPEPDRTAEGGIRIDRGGRSRGDSRPGLRLCRHHRAAPARPRSTASHVSGDVPPLSYIPFVFSMRRPCVPVAAGIRGRRMAPEHEIFTSAAGVRQPTRAAWCVVVLACVLASACGGPTNPAAAPEPRTVGEWSGMTSQGMPMAFSVSPDEVVTTITFGYNFNGCLGSQTFANLSVRTTPDIICVPDPCAATVGSYRSFNYSDGRPTAGPSTTVFGLFLLGNKAQGQVHFVNFPGCGTASSVEWTATRR